jgi:hypothetical protein
VDQPHSTIIWSQFSNGKLNKEINVKIEKSTNQEIYVDKNSSIFDLILNFLFYFLYFAENVVFKELFKVFH